MTNTTTAIITDAWTKISDGQCEVQSISDRFAYDKLFFDLVVSDEEPASDTDAFMMINLNEHANFHRSTPVWLRLNERNASDDQKIVVIK